MITKEESYKQIQLLIERFAEQIDDYKKSGYNETQTRRDFIDPLFKALGWDVDNSAGNAEAYREVIHEAKTMVTDGDSQRLKSPDYAFRLPGGKYLFFVEAKKPTVMIKDDVIPAYQLRRYGWSAKLAVQHDAIVRHVETLLKLHEDKSRETLATRLTAINDRIAHAEDAINSIVYELYGITAGERRAIEGAV